MECPGGGGEGRRRRSCRPSPWWACGRSQRWRRPRSSARQDVTVLRAQTVAGALVCESHDVAADWDVVVVVEDCVGAGANLLGGALAIELYDQLGQQAHETKLMRGAVILNLADAIVHEPRDAFFDVIANRADFFDRAAGGVGDLPILDSRRNVRAGPAAGHRDRPVGVQLHLDCELLGPLAR